MTNPVDMDDVNTVVKFGVWISETLGQYVNKNGLLCRLVNPNTGQIIDSSPQIRDFGDYVQNVAAMGLIADRRDLVSWATDQVKIAYRIAWDNHGIFRTDLFENTHWLPFRYLPIDTMSDALEGINTLYHLTGEIELLDMVRVFVKFLENRMDDSGRVPAIMVGPHYRPLPFLFRPVYHGNFAEDLSILGDTLGDNHFVTLATEMVQWWLKEKYFQRTGLFPSKVVIGTNTKPIRKGINLCYRALSYLTNSPFKGNILDVTGLSKANTNLIAALLALWHLSGKEDYRVAVIRWCHAVRTKLIVGNYWYGYWDDAEGNPYNDEFVLGTIHPAINAFIDAYHAFKEEWLLSTALAGCKIWLDAQSPFGLFPEDPNSIDRTHYTSARRAVLDSQTDFGVILIKLFELTRNREFLARARTCIEGVMKNYKTAYGLVWSVDSQNGNVVCGTNNTKFIGLFLKLLLSYLFAVRGDSLFDNRVAFLISRDR